MEVSLPFDRNSVQDLNEFAKCGDIGSPEFLRLFQGAREYMNSMSWIKRISHSFVGMVRKGSVGIFLFDIKPAKLRVDRFLWVVWGGVPAAYLVLDRARTPKEAASAYVSEVLKWVDCVRSGSPISDVMPLDWRNTAEGADSLETLVLDVFGSLSD